jgi:predicted nucleic acid-binding protein
LTSRCGTNLARNESGRAAGLKRWLVGTLPTRRFQQAIDDLTNLPMARYPTARLMQRAYELRSNGTA